MGYVVSALFPPPSLPLPLLTNQGSLNICCEIEKLLVSIPCCKMLSTQINHISKLFCLSFTSGCELFMTSSALLVTSFQKLPKHSVAHWQTRRGSTHFHTQKLARVCKHCQFVVAWNSFKSRPVAVYGIFTSLARHLYNGTYYIPIFVGGDRGSVMFSGE